MKPKKIEVTNLIFLIIVSLITIYIVSSFIYINYLEKQYLADYNNYEKSRQLITEDKYVEADKILSGLLDKKEHQTSIQVLWNYGVVQAGLGNNSEAEKTYDLIRSLRPFIIMEYNFIAQYGEIKYRLEKYDEALEYFRYTLRISENGEFNEIISDMISSIENKNG